MATVRAVLAAPLSAVAANSVQMKLCVQSYPTDSADAHVSPG